ncbi:MAG: hypothetical protein LBI54_10820 [Lachnospiraceae bacterium]|jgi:hypothetical protein|nr:hypothetical protein [Lachnospiraceae bacterium]
MAMTLAELYAKLQTLSPFTLTDDDGTANAFRWLLFALHAPSLTVGGAKTVFAENRIEITGSVAFGLPAGEYALTMRITAAPPGAERDFTVSLAAAAPVSGSFADVFGRAYPTFRSVDGAAAYEDIMSGLAVSGILAIDYTDDDYSELPLRFTCQAAIPAGEPWAGEPFCALLGIAGASGTLSGGMSPNAAYGDVELSAALELGAAFAELLPSAGPVSAFVGLQNGVSGDSDPVGDFSLYQPYVSKAFAGLSFKLYGLSDTVSISAPLFRGGEYLTLGADFGAGLSPTDMIKFLAALFGGIPGGNLMLPQAGFLDSFGLRSLSVTLREQAGSPFPALYAISPYVATKRPLPLPISGLTLNTLDLCFIIQWGYSEGVWLGKRQVTVEDADSYLLTGDIGAGISLELPNYTTITLTASASLPELEFEGLIKFSRTSGKGADMVMGAAVSGTLPTLPLAEIYVTAGYTSRTLSFDATVYDVFTIKLAGMEVDMAELTAGARFAQGGNSFYFGGTLAFAPAGYDGFSFSLLAAYGNGAWLFEGGLAGGTVSLAALLKGILGLDPPGDFFNSIVLTALWARYLYKSGRDVNPFSLRAAFTWDLSKIITCFAFEMETSAALALETDERGATTASVLAELKISDFTVTVQMDGLGTDLPSYIFTFLFRGKGLRAAYYKVGEKPNINEYLTVNLVKVTLGDIIDFLVTIADPNYEGTLPAPLDALYKIDLSKLALTYGITDDTVEVTYALNLNLIVVKIKSVGLKYLPAKENPADVVMTLKVDTLASNGALSSWSLLRGQPPDFGGQGAVKFELKYIGLLVHFDNAGDESILLVDNIPDALARMEGQPLAVRNPAVNFAFATHFKINGAFEFKAAFIDPHIYGFYITVSQNDGPLKQLNGLALELLYKRISDKLGMFGASLVMPEAYRTFRLGAVTVTLGLITVEIYTDGGFYIDLGFPQNRDFSRSFVLQFGIYTGRAGLYFGILSGAAVPSLPAWENGVFAPVIKAGVGVSFGFGNSFDFGIVAGGLELAAMGIFEGTLALWVKSNDTAPSAMYYKLSATLGIVGRLYVKVDLKIIVLTASVDISAFAQAVFETDRPVLIDLDLSLKLYGSVKILFIKISFSFSFSYHAHFEIGGSNLAGPELPPLNIHRLRLAQKASIPWFLGHSPTLNGQTVFVPMIGDFAPLYGLMVETCLYGTPEVLDKKYADGLNSNYVNQNITLETLFPFIGNNAEFVVSPLPAPPDGDGEQDGFVVPLPPFVTLTLDGDEASARDYSVFNPITDEYADMIKAYFAELESGGALLGSAGTPIAEVLFLDYFRALARQIYGELRGLYDGYTVAPADFAALADRYGVPAAAIAAANDTARLQDGVDIAVSLAYVCPELTSLAALESRFALPDLWGQVAELPILADTIIDVGAFSFASPLEKRVVAAFFYARWYGAVIETHWQAIYDAVLSASGKTAAWECTVFDAGDSFTYAGLAWTVQLGDTAERLAKMFALLNADAGYFPAFDEFLAKVGKTGGTYTLPASPVPVSSAETPAQLARRLFVAASGEQLKAYDIVARFANLPLSGAVFVTGAGQTLAGFVQENGLDYATVAPYLKGEHFAAGEALAFKPAQLPRAEINARLLSDEVRARTAGFASRILTQGSRLPTADGTGTIAFFELCGLQFPLGSGQHTARLAAQAGSWVTGSQTYDITVAANPAIRAKLPDGVAITALPPFAEKPVTYQSADRFLCGSERVVRYLPSAPEGGPFSLYYAEGTAVPSAPALCLPFTVWRESDNVLRVVGLSPADQIKLRPLADWENCAYSILYKPGPLSGMEGVLLDTGFGAGERFIKTNLSRETRLDLAAGAAADGYVCSLAEPAFIKLLWECSVTRGRYALYLSAAAKLPADIFDGDGTARFYLLVTAGDEIAGTANCVVSTDVANAGKNAYFARAGETAAQPVLPNGSYGLRIAYTPEADSVSQILGYTVTLGGQESNLSKPLLPLEDTVSGQAGAAVYEPVFPIGEPYQDFGTAAVNVYLRDVFGNQSAEPTVFDVDFRVNDFIVSANEWYGVACSYVFSAGMATVTLAVTAVGADFALSAQAKADLERALLQQQGAGTALSVVSSLFAGEYAISPNPLPAFLAALLAYYDAAENAGAPVATFSVPLGSGGLPPDPIFPVELALRIKRSVRTAAGAPLPVTQADTALAYDSGDFPVDGYALARKNLSGGRMYAVNLAMCAGTPTFAAPQYYAPAPLAHATVEGADINLWARIFLDDFENTVLADIAALALCPAEAANSLLGIKEGLADKIAQTFIEVQNGGAAPAAVRSAAADMLRGAVNTEISSIAAYALQNSGKTAPTRLTLAIARTDAARVTAQPGKISNTPYFTLAYSAFSRYETDFSVTYSPATVQHFEDNIRATAAGYESSDWYSFVAPQAIPGLGGDVSNIPNPLREIPAAPQLANSRFAPQPGDDLSRCAYCLDITAQAAQQDTISVSILFNSPGAYPVRAGEDIYTALGAYMDARAGLLAGFNENSVASFAGYAQNICDHWAPVSAVKAAAAGGGAINAELYWEGGILKSSNPQITLAYGRPVAFGKPFTVALTIAGLCVYDQTSATPYVKITRNASLAEAFVFCTEEISLPEVTAQNAFDGDLDYGQVGEWTPADISAKCRKAYDSLHIPAEQAALFTESELTYAYTHEGSGAPIRLPVAMFKNALLDDIQNAANAWFSSAAPATNSARLEFSVRVHSGERAVLTARRIIVR